MDNRMASKTTIAKTEEYHLYREPYDDDKIHLELDDSIEFRTVENFYGDTPEKKLIVTIPKEVWEQIIQGYLDDRIGDVHASAFEKLAK